MGSARGDRDEQIGAGAPPVAAPGIIGQVASHLPINIDKKQAKMSIRAFRMIGTTKGILRECLRKCEE